MTNSKSKTLAILSLVIGIGAFALAIAAASGALELDLQSGPVAVDVPVQQVDEPVNVESLGEIIIIGSADGTPDAHALGAALAQKRGRRSAERGRGRCS